MEETFTYEPPVAVELGDFATETMGSGGRGYDQNDERRGWWW